MNIEVNYLAILLAGVASMALGFIWYSPFFLGKPWSKEKGFDKLSKEEKAKAQKEMGKFYGVSFLVSLLTAYVLAHTMALSVNYFHYPMLQTAFTTGFFVWLGYLMPVQLTATIFGNKNWKLFGIDTSYQLVSILVMGIVLALL